MFRIQATGGEKRTSERVTAVGDDDALEEIRRCGLSSVDPTMSHQNDTQCDRNSDTFALEAK